MIGGIIGAVIFVVIFAAMIPTVANSQVAATNNANVTGAASSLTSLISLIFVAMGILGMFRGFLG